MNRVIRLVAGLALVLSVPAFAFADTAPDLGDAEALGIFAMPSETNTADPGCFPVVSPCLRVTSSSSVTGDLAVFDNGQYEKTSGSVVTGNVFLGAGATTNIGGDLGDAGTLVPDTNLDQHLDDALQASLHSAGLTVTQALGLVDGNFIDDDATNDNSRTLTGIGGLNVYSVTDISLSGSEKLVLAGDATDYFIFNISGNLGLSGSSGILLDGVGADQVLFNVFGAGDNHIDITAGGVGLGEDIGIYGTILAPDRDVDMHGRLVGAIFANDIEFGSGAFFLQDTFDGPNPPPPPPGVIPEPGSLLLMGMGLTGLGAFSRRRVIRRR